MDLPDVQSSLPEVRINLTRVGVKNVKKLVEVARPGKRPVIFISVFDVFVDLPGSLKGANLSRNFEVIDDVLQHAIDGDVNGIEELCSAVARKLLDRHEYAERTEVRMRSQFMVRRETPVSETSCHEVVNVHASAVAQRNDGNPIIRKSIGAEVTGMTACPCAQNIMPCMSSRTLAWRRKRSRHSSRRCRWPRTTSAVGASSALRQMTISMSASRRSSRS